MRRVLILARVADGMVLSATQGLGGAYRQLGLFRPISGTALPSELGKARRWQRSMPARSARVGLSDQLLVA